MATEKNPTPEELEAARALIAKADAAEARRVRQQTRDLVAPFIEAGWGSSDENSAIRVAIRALKEKAITLSAYDPNLPNSFFTTATVMETVDDKIRTMAAMSAEQPAS